MARNASSTFDGLVVGYGTHSADNEIAAVTQGANGSVIVSLEVDMVNVVTAATSVTYPNAGPATPHSIPRGSVIMGGYVVCLIALTGAGADFDIGLWSRGLDTEVVDDANGLVDALLLAELANVGDVSILDGDLVADAADSGVAVAGATSNSDVIITLEYDTIITAGKIRVVVEYMPPTGSISPLEV